jgi:hypothetical protein
MDNTQKEIRGQMKPIDFDIKYPIISTYKHYPSFHDGIGIATVNHVISIMKSKISKCLNVPERFNNSTLENYESIENMGVLSQIKKITDIGFVDDKIGQISSIFWSKNLFGVGKTHLIYAAMKEYALDDKRFEVGKIENRNVSIVYNALSILVIPEYTLINKVRETFKSNSEKTEGDVFCELSNYDILCIDDVVKYTPTNLDFYQRVMFQIIDERYNHKQSLFITTNKSLPQLAESIGVAASDRLFEMTKGYQLEFKGKSHRSVSNG